MSSRNPATMKPLSTADRRPANANYTSTTRPRVASGSGAGEGDAGSRAHRSARSGGMGTAAELRERRTEKREVRERETEVRRTRSPQKHPGESRRSRMWLRSIGLTSALVARS